MSRPIISQGPSRRPPIRSVLSGALRTYREEFPRVAGTAFVIFGTVAALDAIAVVLVVDEHVSRPVGAALTSGVAAVMGMVAVVFYEGVLDKIVGAHLHGEPDLPLREILRVLPLRRLAGADVVLALITLAALGVGVIPGVIAFTFLALVGPIITIEDLRVRDAFRRSAQLVRAGFWLTLLLVTLPIQLEQGVLHAIHYADVFQHPVLPALLLNGLLGAVIGSIVGLIEVVLAHDFIARSKSAS